MGEGTLVGVLGGIGVLVEVGTGVRVGVDVGGRVAVGGAGVRVAAGGIGVRVAVGGADVAVLVGGAGVDVAAARVNVAEGVADGDGEPGATVPDVADGSAGVVLDPPLSKTIATMTIRPPKSAPRPMTATAICSVVH